MSENTVAEKKALRILVVDDSERDAELLVRDVEAAGYDVAWQRVDTAEALTSALTRREWDVILADYRMPQFNGVEALGVLQESGWDLPFIVVSGTIGEESAVALMKAGAHDFIMKDRLARLVPVIEREIAEAAQRSARRQAEARLRERERMLADAQRVAHLGSWEWDLQSGSMSWSDEAFRILGYEIPASPRGLAIYLDAVHPDDRALVEQILEAVVEVGESHDVEHRITRPDGTQRWLFHRVRLESVDLPHRTRLVGTLLDTTERRRAIEALRESEENYRILLEQAADGIVVADREGRIVTVNSRACEMLGYTPDEFVGRRLVEFLDPEELAARPLRDRRLRSGETLINERALSRRDGTFIPTETSSKLLDDGRVQIIVRDIAERKQAEQALRRSEQEYRNLYERANDAIVIFAIDDAEVLDVNARACELYGIPHEQFIGRSLRALTQGDRAEEIEREVHLAKEAVQGHESVRYRADGTQLQLLISSSVVEFQGRDAVLSIQRDISAQKELERQLAHQALHDALTGLANRALFQDRLEHALARARGDEEDVAILMLDLDRFKVVNESLGHEAGDRLLIAFAERLMGGARDEDTVARLGGDEFAILLEGVTNLREITLVAERVSNLLQLPFDLDGHQVVVTSSIGIVVSPRGREPADALLRDADVAMYRAKEEGRARYVVHDPSMNATMLERLKMEADLRQAIARGELRVYYQPTVALSNGRVMGMEALVRWMHPAHGLISPAAFIPLAEETGLIRPLGQWVLTTACRQLQRWQMRFPDAAPIILNVNLSAQEFQHPEVVADVAEVLDLTGIDARYLQLEITESVVMSDVAATYARLRQLKELGVQLAIDDFGTGYSSLSYLKRFAVDTLKVDKAFVGGLGSDPEDTAIVQAMISLAQTLGLTVTAEGVETDAALKLLQELGCELGQGFLFTEPLPADALDPLWSKGLQINSRWRSRLAS